MACNFLLPLAVQSTNFLHREQTSLRKAAKQKTVHDGTGLSSRLHQKLHTAVSLPGPRFAFCALYVGSQQQGGSNWASFPNRHNYKFSKIHSQWWHNSPVDYLCSASYNSGTGPMIAAASVQCLCVCEMHLHGLNSGLLFVCRLRAWRQEWAGGVTSRCVGAYL